jgi:hypothetical protein
VRKFLLQFATAVNISTNAEKHIYIAPGHLKTMHVLR